MTTEQTYLKNCQRCRTQTKHTPVILSRKRGIKLRCLNCGYQNIRFYNLNSLQSYSVKETKLEEIKNDRNNRA